MRNLEFFIWPNRGLLGTDNVVTVNFKGLNLASLNCGHDCAPQFARVVLIFMNQIRIVQSSCFLNAYMFLISK